jgi:hypothetical protein
MGQFSVWAGVLLFAGIAAGQVVPDRYIIELSAEPAASAGKGAVRAAMDDRRAAVAAQQQRVRTAIAAESVELLGSVDTVANALFVHARAEQIHGCGRLLASCASILCGCTGRPWIVPFT